MQVAFPENSENKAIEFYLEILDFKDISKPDNLQRRDGVWFQVRNNHL